MPGLHLALKTAVVTLVVASLQLTQPLALGAHGGELIASEDAGPYFVQLFMPTANPQPGSQVDITITLHSIETGRPVDDGIVVATFENDDGTSPAQVASVFGNQYELRTWAPGGGKWIIQLDIDAGSGTTQTEFVIWSGGPGGIGLQRLIVIAVLATVSLLTLVVLTIRYSSLALAVVAYTNRFWTRENLDR